MIEHRVTQAHFVPQIPLKDESEDTRPTSPKSIIKHRQPVSKENLARIAVKEGKPEFTEDENNVFVEIVADENSHSPVAPPAVA